MITVFFSVSQASQMRLLAWECATHLASKSIKVLDAESIEAGERWDAQLLSLIRRADVVVAFYDQPSAALGVELGIALGAQKQLLLVTEAHAQVPPLLNDVEVLSVSADRERFYERLESAISRLSAARQDLASFINDIDQFAVLYRSDPGIVEQLSHEQFEQLVTKYFEVLGYEPHAPSRDSGYDLVLDRFEGSGRVAVEVKKWPRSRRVPIGAVQQLLGSLFGQHVDRGLLLSTAEFTESARDIAARTGGRVRLLSFDDLARQFEDGKKASMQSKPKR